MLLPFRPMSPGERRRLFLERHPGYDRRRKARERGMAKRGAANRDLLRRLAAEAKCEAVRPVLMLPAPVEDPVMAELKALAASLASAPARQPLPSRAA